MLSLATTPGPKQPDAGFQEFLSEMTLRIAFRRMEDFEEVWEAANRICDKYEESQAA